MDVIVLTVHNQRPGKTSWRTRQALKEMTLRQVFGCIAITIFLPFYFRGC